MTDEISSIFGIIKDMCNYRASRMVEKEAVEKRVLARGLSLDDLEKTLYHYEQMNVLMLHKDDTIQIVE